MFRSTGFDMAMTFAAVMTFGNPSRVVGRLTAEISTKRSIDAWRKSIASLQPSINLPISSTSDGNTVPGLHPRQGWLARGFTRGSASSKLVSLEVAAIHSF